MSRIVILLRRYCPGEAWTNRVLAYAKAFAELGENVCIYTLINDYSKSSERLEVPNVKVINLWESDGFFSVRFKIISFLKNLIRFRYQIQQGDRLFLYGLYQSQFLLVRTLNNKVHCYCESTEHPGVFKEFKASRIKNLAKSINRLDAFFVISNALKKFYESIGVDENRIHVVNMFVDTNRFQGLKKTSSEKYIAYCGAVSYDKDGANILIEAFAKFLKTHDDYKLYVIGKGVDNNTISKLKESANSLGVCDFVNFTGPIASAYIPQILYNANILALARPNNLQAQNGFPTKLGEYLATGNPVVVTRVGEIPHFIKHKVNGFLSDPNPDSFAEQLSWIADNYGESQQIGLCGKLLVSDEFSYYSQSKKVLYVMSKQNYSNEY